MATSRRRPGPALAALALCAALLCFLSAPARAQGVDMGCSPTVADPCDGRGDDSPVYRVPRDDSAERAERHAAFENYKAGIEQSNTALAAGRYREAAQIRRQTVATYGSAVQGASTRSTLKYADELEQQADAQDVMNAGDRAAAAGDYAQAIRYYELGLKNPAFNNKHNRDIFDELKRRLKAQQTAARDAVTTQDDADRRAREAAASAAAVAAAERAERDRALAAEFARGRDSSPLKDGGVGQGGQLGAIARVEGQLEGLDRDAASEAASVGFDRPLNAYGALIYPDKNKYRQIPPSALERQVPPALRNDPQIRQVLAWSQSLDRAKADKQRSITALKTEQAATHDPLVTAKLDVLADDVKRLTDDQAAAKAVVKAKVLNKGMAWDEAPPAPESGGELK